MQPNRNEPPKAPRLPVPELEFPLVTRREAARLLTEAGYPVKHRTLEVWDLPRFKIVFRVAYRVADVFAEAQRRLDDSVYYWETTGKNPRGRPRHQPATPAEAAGEASSPAAA